MKRYYCILLVLMILPVFVLAGDERVMSKQSVIKITNHPAMSGLWFNNSTQLPAIRIDSNSGKNSEQTFNPMENEVWNLLPLTNPPPARYYHIQVYDSKRNTITVFGGWHYNPANNTYIMYDDTWQADFETNAWLKINMDISPSPRGAHAILDSANNRILLYGGIAFDGEKISLYNDLWQFILDSLKWEELHPSGLYPESVASPLIHDPVNNRVLFFGGEWGDPYTNSDQTWALHLADLRWEQLSTNGILPHARLGHGAVYDPLKHRMIIFGGKYYSEDLGYTFFNDLWELNLETLEWAEIPTNANHPEPRDAMCMILDAPKNRLVIFGGEKWDYTSLNDLWEFNLSINRWQELTTSGGTPEKRSFSCGDYDQIQSRILIFGGTNSFSSMLNDTWESKLGPVGIEPQPIAEIPRSFALEQNYPNSFNPTTTIGYQLPATSFVELSIVNILGHKVATLVSEKQPAGIYKVEWDATGRASGIYFYKLITDQGFIQTKKLILLK